MSQQRLVPTLVFSCEHFVQQAYEEPYVLIVVDAEFACDHASCCLDRMGEESAAPVVAVGDIEMDVQRTVNFALDDEGLTQDPAADETVVIDVASRVQRPFATRWHQLELDPRTHQARWNGFPLHLTALQFRIMEVLVVAAGGLVTDEQMARRVWGESSFQDFARLVAHVRRIRRLIESEPSKPEFLLRVRGRGFRLTDEEPQRNL